MSKRKFRFLKIFFKILIIIVSIILLYFIVIIAINSKKDYSPAISEDLEIKKDAMRGYLVMKAFL